MATEAHSTERTEGTSAPFERVAAEWCRQSPEASWAVVFGFLAALAAILLIAPLSSIPAHYQVNYNEGWNTYLQRTAAAGGHIYGEPPRYVYAAYPPLSFHIVGLLGRAFGGDMLLAGRLVAAVSFFAIALLIALIVRRLTGTVRCGLYAALMFIVFLATLKSERIGMNDPHLLGVALGALGLYFLVRDPSSARWLGLSAAAFSLSLFTKHSEVAIPAAAAVYLFRYSKRAWITWIGAAFALCCLLLALTFAVDGRYFLQHFAFPRGYALSNLWDTIGWYVLSFQAAIAAAIVWTFFAPRKTPAELLALSFVVCHAAAVWFAGGDGVDRNILFDAVITLALVAGMLAPYAARFSAATPSRKPLLAILLLIPFLGPLAPLLAGRLGAELAAASNRGARDAEFAEVVQFVQAQPGDGFCDAPLICYDAGKPESYDVYTVGQLVKTGKMPEADLLALLRNHRLGVVEMDSVNPAGAPRLNGYNRLPEAFFDELLADYRLVLRTPHYAVFTPK